MAARTAADLRSEQITGLRHFADENRRSAEVFRQDARQMLERAIENEREAIAQENFALELEGSEGDLTYEIDAFENAILCGLSCPSREEIQDWLDERGVRFGFDACDSICTFIHLLKRAQPTPEDPRIVRENFVVDDDARAIRTGLGGAFEHYRAFKMSDVPPERRVWNFDTHEWMELSSITPVLHDGDKIVTRTIADLAETSDGGLKREHFVMPEGWDDEHPLPKGSAVYLWNDKLGRVLAKEGSGFLYDLTNEAWVSIADAPTLEPGDRAIFRSRFIFEEPEVAPRRISDSPQA